MKEMCLDCYGTGRIRCQHCGGTGVMPNVSLLGEDCLKCNGSGYERHQLCRGTGYIGADVTPLQPPAAQIKPPARRVEQGLPAAA